LFSKKSISGRIGTVAAGLLFLITSLLSAQEVEKTDLPGWILYQKGVDLFEQGSLSNALDLITLSAGNGILTPEATYMIGRIYEAEGDYLLAKKQYNEALANAKFLYIPGDKWQIHYSLADLSLNEKDFDQYEQILLSIFDDEMKRNSEIIRREHSYIQVLKSDGLDKLLLLYRLKLTYSLEATSRLGRFYNKQELWKSSLIKNIYPLLTIFSGGIETLINRYPDFSFPVNMDEAWLSDEEFLIDLYEDFCQKSHSDFVFQRDLQTLEADHVTEDRDKAEKIIKAAFPFFHMTPSAYVLLKMESHEREISSLNMDDLYSSLYFIGEALYQEGSPYRANEVWSLLNMSHISSSWKKLAQVKLRDPDTKTPFLKY